MTAGAGIPADGFPEFVNQLATSLARPHLAEARPETKLGDLGLDSLAMLELLVVLDELGVLQEQHLLDPAWMTADVGKMPLGALYTHFVAPNLGAASQRTAGMGDTS